MPVPDRKLYKIGQLVKLLGVTPRTVRYYDQFGLLPHVKRSDGGMRLFDDEDVAIVRRVRDMQVRDNLSLDAIRSILHGESDMSISSELAVVTDVFSVIPSDLMSSISFAIMPQSVDDLVSFFLSYADKGFRKLYAIHSSFSSDIVRLAIDRVGFSIAVMSVDTLSFGAGLGLFVVEISRAILLGESQLKVELLIKKLMASPFQLVSVSGLGASSTGLDAAFSQLKGLSSQVLSFCPVYQLFSDGREVDVVDCVKSTEKSVVLMLSLFEAEFAIRGRYSRAIVVFFSFLHGEALALIDGLKTIAPTTPLYLQENSKEVLGVLGDKVVGLAII